MGRRDRGAGLHRGTVRLYNPKSGGTYRAPASAAPFWEKRGWKPESSQKSQAAKSQATKSQPAQGEKGGE